MNKLTDHMTVMALAATLVVASQLAGGPTNTEQVYSWLDGYSSLDLIVGIVALLVMVAAPYSNMERWDKIAASSVFGLIGHHLAKTILSLSNREMPGYMGENEVSYGSFLLVSVVAYAVILFRTAKR